MICSTIFWEICISNSNPDDVTKPLKPIYFLNMEVRGLDFLAYIRLFRKTCLCFLYIMYMFINKFFKNIDIIMSDSASGLKVVPSVANSLTQGSKV